MAVPDSIQEACRQVLGKPIRRMDTVSGGDINEAYRLSTDSGSYFLKYNTFAQGAEMLATEARGLQLIAATATLTTPEVLAQGETEAGAYLLFPYLEPVRPDTGFWEAFGTALGDMHRHSAPRFGLSFSNFIGRLPQPNVQQKNWAAFYWTCRLAPQIELAESRQLLPAPFRKRLEFLATQLEDRCPTEPPALIHGDLWRGNFLCTETYGAVLIDPAPSYAHREMDLAMARLFGGFDERFFRAYAATYPLEPGLMDRLPIYQLYYLLVHLNLFGRSYLSSIEQALTQLGL
ncbi:MAG: fructosamine kinase family protein [Phaeodactylibacter sp.]|nr:fructosamine kinase family protein [Phaeodactylibacter sp.]